MKITPDGKVKVLDFGLAKAFETEASKANLSQSPTLSMAATNAGVILGTAAYMSPEQAKGRTVDKRTDIFAFGCVLYEMLTGRAAFEGEDVQDILGAVLKSEPDWTRLPAEMPPAIRKLLRLCLEKNAKNRRSDAADVRIDIEQALAEPVAAMPATPPTRSARLAWIVSAAAVLWPQCWLFLLCVICARRRRTAELPFPDHAAFRIAFFERSGFPPMDATSPSSPPRCRVDKQESEPRSRYLVDPRTRFARIASDPGNGRIIISFLVTR